MGDFRFTYGTARGPEGNFQARTDNLFAADDTTPDVSNGNLFYANNAAATSITYFDVPGPDAVSRHQGKEITVVMLDTGTTIAPSGVLYTEDSATTQRGIGNVFHFVFVNSTWYQTGKTLNDTRIGAVAVDSTTFASDVGDLTIGSETEQLNVTVQASSTFTLRRLLSGYVGQTVRVFAVSSTVAIAANSAGASGSFVVTSTGGTTYNLLGSGMAVFTLTLQDSTAKWIEHTDES